VRVRGQVLSWFHAAIPVGSALGYTLGGWAGWPWSFYLVVPPGLLLGALCFFMKEPRRGQTDFHPHENANVRHVSLKDYKLLFRNPSFVLATLGMTCLTFALGGIAYWMPRFIIDYRHAGAKETVNTIFGLVIVVSGLISTLLGGLAGDWLRRYHSGSYFLVSGVAMFLSFPLFLWSIYAPFPLAWVLIFFACFFLFFNTGPTNTILANVTHPSLRAPAFALNIFIIHALGDAISPTVIGLVADLNRVDGQADLPLGFVAVSGMILLGGILWLIGARYLGRDTERAIHQLDGPPGQKPPVSPPPGSDQGI
jgi:predicted MFS family arabinose efflux permease